MLVLNIESDDRLIIFSTFYVSDFSTNSLIYMYRAGPLNDNFSAAYYFVSLTLISDKRK